jgi:predicted secreted acid phosphatase
MKALIAAMGLSLSQAAGAQTVPLPPAQVPPPAPSTLPPAPAGMQYLYASGEADALTRTVWHALVDFVSAHRAARKSVVLAAGTLPEAHQWLKCTKDQPLAAVFDVDETVLLNLGAEYDAAVGTPYSDARWQQWEVHGGQKVQPSPGAVEALAALRAMHVTVIFNTNRLAIDHDQNSATIEHAGLGPAKYFADATHWREQTLYLADGSHYPDTAKDPRRAFIASHYCVIAMAGDQLGDFSDAFTPQTKVTPLERRALTEQRGVAEMWGQGWFAFPNPVYGWGVKGDVNEVFAPAMRWPADEVEKN